MRRVRVRGQQYQSTICCGLGVADPLQPIADAVDMRVNTNSLNILPSDIHNLPGKSSENDNIGCREDPSSFGNLRS